MDLLEIRDSKNKPFKIAKVQKEDKEVYVVLLGQTKMDTEFTSYKEVEKWIDSKPYKLIFMLTEVVVNYLKEN